MSADIVADEKVIGYFIGQVRPKFWLFFVMGPLAALTLKHYYVLVSDKGIHFYRMSAMGKIRSGDFFAYDEISALKVGKGVLQKPLTFRFANRKKLSMGALIKGIEKVAKMDDATLAYMRDRIRAA